MKIIRKPSDRPTARWFTFDQNNSGGNFVYDEQAGISTKVLIEAHSATEANRIAQGIGLYFDGDGDCSCCGDRWYSKWSNDEGDDEPLIYGVPVTKFRRSAFREKWMDEGQFEFFTHHLDGTVIGYLDTVQDYIEGEIVEPTKELEA